MVLVKCLRPRLKWTPEEDDYTGFYSVDENGAMAPDKVAQAGAEDSSDDEFCLIGTRDISAMPVVTAFPRVIASDDESDGDSGDGGDVSLSNTEVRLLEGGVVSDKDTALERSVTLRNRCLMTLLVMVMMPMMLRLQQGRADPRRGQRRKTKSKKEFSLKGGRISMIEYLEENYEV